MQPASHSAAVYLPEAAGKLAVEVGSTVSIVQLKAAGLLSVLPAGSVARTSKL